MILTGENRKTRRKTCYNTTLTTLNTETRGSNPYRYTYCCVFVCVYVYVYIYIYIYISAVSSLLVSSSSLPNNTSVDNRKHRVLSERELVQGNEDWLYIQTDGQLFIVAATGNETCADCCCCQMYTAEIHCRV